MGQTPSSIRNIVITQSGGGNRWDCDFEWNNAPDQSGEWGQFLSQFPRDFADINVDDSQQALLELALAVFAGRDVIPDDN